MSAWLKRKNSGSSRRSINNVKRRFLELPSISLIRSSSVHRSPMLVISSIRRMGCEVLTAIRHRGMAPMVHGDCSHRNSDRTSSTTDQSEGDSEYTTTGHHSAPHSVAPPGDTAVSVDNSRSTTGPGNGLDGQASPKVQNSNDRNITEPVESSSTPEILVPHHWQQQLRHSISSPILLSTNLGRLKEEFYNAPATVVHRPSLASRPTVLPEENELYSIVPSPPFGFRDTDSASPPAQLHSSNPPSQVSTAPTSILSSNSGQNACKFEPPGVVV
jgi:hypothetical protein